MADMQLKIIAEERGTTILLFLKLIKTILLIEITSKSKLIIVTKFYLLI
jgi:hypothetical protein